MNCLTFGFIIHCTFCRLFVQLDQSFDLRNVSERFVMVGSVCRDVDRI